MRLMTIGSTPEVMILSHFLRSRLRQSKPGRRELRFRGHLAALADQRRGDDLVVFRDVEIAGLGVQRKRKKVEYVARIESAGVGRDSRGKICNADNLDTVLGDDLVELGALDVASLLRGEIDDHRAGFHGGDGLGTDQLRRRTAWNERRRK